MTDRLPLVQVVDPNYFPTVYGVGVEIRCLKDKERLDTLLYTYTNHASLALTLDGESPDTLSDSCIHFRPSSEFRRCCPFPKTSKQRPPHPHLRPRSFPARLHRRFNPLWSQEEGWNLGSRHSHLDLRQAMFGCCLRHEECVQGSSCYCYQ